jgi:cytochrome c6
VAPAAPPPAATPPAAAPAHVASAADAARAKATWKKRCASCHATDGSGKAAKARALQLAAGTLDLGRAPLASDDARAIIVQGKGKMPAFGKKLKSGEIDRVTAYAVDLAAARRAKTK